MHLRILLNSDELKDLLLILGTLEDGNSMVKSVWKTTVCFTKKGFEVLINENQNMFLSQ